MAKYRFLISINLVYTTVITSNFYVVSGKSKMAAIYTASSITIFLNVVGSYLWRLNSCWYKKIHNIKQLNFHVTCIYGNSKNIIIQNNTLIMGKLYKNSMCYFHHCNYIGLMCISQNCINAIILHSDNARIINLINILITSLCSFGIDVATVSH